ncbi:MAG: hypothetical protein K1X28_05120 [Parachlamydiales bacterium]|nr:hypothetical protein [Parachlamydiales bacterium]
MKQLICIVLIIFSAFSDQTSQSIPWCWSNGEPIWIEGEPLPPDGKGLVIVCARKGGILNHNPKVTDIFRDKHSCFGHVWIEFLDHHGMLSSMSINKPYVVAMEDCVNYSIDKDTFRFAFLVPNERISQIQTAIISDVKMGYHLLWNSCVAVSGHGADIAGVIDFLSPDNSSLFNSEHIQAPFTWGETGVGIRAATPSIVFSALKMKTEELIGLDLSDTGLENQTFIHHCCAAGAVACPPFSLKVEADSARLPRRGNFGGIVLSKIASLSLEIEDIHGAIFDEKTSQLILVGTKPIYLPPMRLDDLAVAMQSIYGLKGKPPQDPGVSLDHGSEGKMIVTYYGEVSGTEFGKALFEGDYTLKMLLLGKYSCQVPGFKSLAERYWLHSQKDLNGCNFRTWIMPDQISLTQSADGSSMIFSEVTMKCNAVTTCQGKNAYGLAHEECAQFITDHYESISKEFPIFSDLKRLGQITGLVKWLKENKIDFDPDFFKSYQPKYITTPEWIPSITAESMKDQEGIRLTGGVIYYLGAKNFSLTTDRSLDSFKEKVMESRPSDSALVWDYDNLRVQAFPFAKTRKEGNFVSASIDIDGPIGFVRFYDSFNDEDVGLGRGWSVVPYQIITHPIGNSPYLIIREGGQHWVYRFTNGFYLREDNSQMLIKTKEGFWALLLSDGQLCVFNSSGKLVQFVNQRKILTEYLYENDRLSEIRQGGNSICLRYSMNHRMDRVETSSGTCVNYYFDGQKQLKSVSIDGESKIDYKYDKDLRLTCMLENNGNVLFRGSYDDFNRLITQKWSLFPAIF